MASEKDTPQPAATQVSPRQPPDYLQQNIKDIAPLGGLYIITNTMSRTIVAGSQGGGRCQAFSQDFSEKFGRQLWIVQRSNLSSETFTLQNFEFLTFLEVSEGKTDNGTPVVATVADRNRLIQEWTIVEAGPYCYTIQCARTSTFLEIANGNPQNGAAITCSARTAGRDHQLWDLTRVSRTGEEIGAILDLWRPDFLSRVLQPHESFVEYFVLPGQLPRTIWEGTKLPRQLVRRHLFEYDDFVIKAKDAAKTWASERISTDREGYCLLFGLIYGKAKRGPNAYNWYLSPDMRSLVFFDAQTGKEYTSASLDEFEFQPSFATF